MSSRPLSLPALLLAFSLFSPALPGCQPAATDDDDAANDDDATADDDDATADDDDSAGDDDDSSGDDDDSSGAPPETVFVASPPVNGGASTAISEPDGTVFWTGTGTQQVGGLACGADPGTLLAVVMDIPATYTLLGLDASGATTSFDTYFSIPVGGGVSVTHRQPEVVSCGGTTYLATPEVLVAPTPTPSTLVTLNGGAIWSAPAGRSIGGLACDGVSLYVTTVGGTLPNYRLHRLDLNGNASSETTYFDSAGYEVRDLGVQPEVAACDGTVYLATPTLIDAGGTSVERSDVPTTVRTEAGAVLWSGGADVDVGGLTCDGDGGIYVMVSGGDPLAYELLQLSAAGEVLSATTTFELILGSTLNSRDAEVASCPVPADPLPDRR